MDTDIVAICFVAIALWVHSASMKYFTHILH